MPKSAHVYVASAYPQWKQDTLAHLRSCLEANGGKAFALDVMKGLKVIFNAGRVFVDLNVCVSVCAVGVPVFVQGFRHSTDVSIYFLRASLALIVFTPPRVGRAYSGDGVLANLLVWVLARVFRSIVGKTTQDFLAWVCMDVSAFLDDGRDDSCVVAFVMGEMTLVW